MDVIQQKQAEMPDVTGIKIERRLVFAHPAVG